MGNIEDDREVLKELREIIKNKGNWGKIIDNVAFKLSEENSVTVKAKVLWLLGEIGLNYPVKVKKYVADIANYLNDDCPKLRERSVNALGRIGRADKNLVMPYLDEIVEMRKDSIADVRLAFVWACENITTNAPELFCEKLNLFYEMIQDKS